jgi:2-dehydro-3-deoxyphosphooctonate aldolase (KDO 8-P synthase)
MQASEITRPIVYAGPCVAESLDLMRTVVAPLLKLAKELDFDLTFKASFDKANRTSIDSYRGPGIAQTLEWFKTIKSEFGVPVLTDIHEPNHAKEVASVVDVLQIPAFLCRQTDLLIAAVETGRMVNVKKGQFVAPSGMQNAVDKAREAASRKKIPLKLALTERGASFGYGNLVVDQRAFPIMASTGVPVIFDITHSTQLPGGGADGKVTAGERRFAPTLARAATATGYLSGYFLEVHSNPGQAKSDKAVQLSISQAETLLRQVIPFWYQCRKLAEIDSKFSDNP